MGDYRRPFNNHNDILNKTASTVPVYHATQRNSNTKIVV